MSNTPRYALFSGGHDSLVSTYEAMEHGDADKVVHIDTGISIPETQQFVRDVCERMGWPLEFVSSDFSYREIVLENQFPGPAVHIIMYSKLKERALRNVARWHDDVQPILITGVRRDESNRRFRNVKPYQEGDMWVWHANIHDYGTADIENAIDDYGLPRSPVKQRYHHSGECLCGAFGNRTEELVVLEAHYPETAERIKALESEVQDQHGDDDPRSYWAHGGMSSIDLRAMLADNDESQMLLCASCEQSDD
jgi:3'-phosphoadenosine 5'-phosphosulfate sulfotransferase (PAPS reductase)/FAD synthetase